jgi:hypothetical protein
MPSKVLNGLDLTGTKIINVGSPSSGGDAVNKTYVDNVAAGLDAKQSVRAATTANITLTGTQTVDGVALIALDRALVKNQTTASQDGIYIVAAGAWTLAADSQTGTLTSGALVSVEEGTLNGSKSFVLTNANPITVGTTAQVWSPFSAGNTYTAGVNGGLVLTSSAFSVLLDSSPGLLLGAGGIKVDPAYSGLAKRYAVNVPASTPATITHALGTLDVGVSVYEISTGNLVEPDVAVTSTSVVTLTFGTAPTVGQYRCVVIG